MRTSSPVFFRDLRFIFSAEALAGFFAFAYTLICARALGVQRFGLFQSFMGIYALLAFFNSPLLLASIHCTAAASSSGARQKTINELISAAFLISAIPALTVLAGSHALVKWLNGPSISPPVLVSFMLIQKTVLAVFYGVFQGQNDYPQYARTRVIEIGSVFLWGSLTVFIFRNTASALSGYGLGMLTALFLTRKRVPYTPAYPGEALKREFRSIFNIMCCFCFITVIDSLPVILARSQISKDESGFFGALYNLRNVLMPFVFGVTAPLYSRIVSRQEEPSLFRNALMVILILGFGSLLVSLAAPKIIISIFYGREFLGSASYMPAYSISLFMQMLTMLFLFHDAARKELNLIFLILPAAVFLIMAFAWAKTFLGFIEAQWAGWGTYLGTVFLFRLARKLRFASA